METIENKKQTKLSSKKLNTAGVRVNKETRRDLTRLVDKINKKQFGKRVKISEVIALAITLVGEKHIQLLQQSSLSNADKIEMQYKDYIRQNGSISKDDFLGKLHDLMLGKLTPNES
ncbi:MAG: hypothetical protein HOO06_05210 [Bdellovibrionaceae bacterium]|jgi:hypothetical protein|nr:hypothetical protein [Pseudobdellovibrionaceae bacterium]